MNTNSGFRVCDHCGTRIPADSVFCPDCGKALRPTRLSRQSQRRAGRSGVEGAGALWALLGLAAIIIAVIIWINLPHHPSSPVAVGTSQPASSHHPKRGVPSAKNSRPKSHQTTPTRAKGSGTQSSGRPHPKTPSASSSLHHHRKIRPQTTPPTLKSGWSAEAVQYQGTSINVTIPKTLTETRRRLSSTQWQWANAGNNAYRVVLQALPPSSSPPTGTSALGPGAYGTPIVRHGAMAEQTLYVDWAGHAWVAVTMKVPSSHINWLATIAQSVHVG